MRILVSVIVTLILVAFSYVTLSDQTESKTILMVLTSADTLTGKEGSKHPTGYWLEEFSTPYKIFTENGVFVVIATPNGVRPKPDPRSIEVGKDGKAAYWSSQDEFKEALRIKEKTLDKGKIESLADLNKKGLQKFDAVFFPGGHGPMEDLAKDTEVAKTLQYFHSQKKPTALVCHGPIALLSTGHGKDFLYKGYRMTAYSNSEESQTEIGKFMITTPETALQEAGAVFVKGEDWKSHVIEDRELITGQNPASSKAIALAVMRRLKKKK